MGNKNKIKHVKKEREIHYIIYYKTFRAYMYILI